MPSPRNAIIVALAVLAVALATAILSTLAPPDSGGIGRDSYGVEALGQRGIFDTLAALGIAVERRTAPPLPDLPPATLVLLAPSPSIVGFNSRYLAGLMPWVEAGGRIVVAPAPPTAPEPGDGARRSRGQVTPVDVATALGLDGLVVVDAGPAAGRDRQEPDDSLASRGRRALEGMLRGGVRLEAWLDDVECTGAWAEAGPDIRRIALPVGRRLGLEYGDHRAVATLVIPDRAAEELPDEEPASSAPRVIAAAFSRGAGSIVVVADPALFANRFLGQADNAVAAVRLLAPDSQPVVFDEFHHGLGPRGQPLWLVTRPGFGPVAAALLATVLLVVWRQGTRLGPPIADRPVDRRGIGEYLDAMGHLLSQGGGDPRAIVADVRAGIARELALRAGLPPEEADLGRLQTALARRDPIRAHAAVGTLRDVDRLLAADRWTTARTLETLRRLSQCL